MKLVLLHGRTDPAAPMDDFGFNGPKLSNIIAVHVTYLAEIHVYFETHQAAKLAQEQTGWELWGGASLVVSVRDDLIKTSEPTGLHYYGDWEVQV